MMNDFTKEELMNITDAILYSELFETRKQSLIPIRDKIQSLIDSYCEHKVMRSVWSGKCEKCGKELL